MGEGGVIAKVNPTHVGMDQLDRWFRNVGN